MVCKARFAFRGHHEATSEDEANKGIFLALAEFISKYDETSCSHKKCTDRQKSER